jgi:hypothetical protein
MVTFVGTALAGPPKNLTEFGPSLSMGDGYIRAFSTVNPSGKPIRIGVEFDGAAFQNLPTAESDGKWEYDGHTCCGHEHVLQFPSNAVATPFKWAMVNWNPGGHIPPGVWDLPHFDFHFYFMEEAERYNITAGICDAAAPGTLISCEAFQKGMKPLPADEEVPGYINPGAVEAGMGAHLIDPTSPEFNGATFTRTFLYGAWDGSLNFMEPMITVAELQKKEAEHCTPYPTPEAMPEAGFYPTEYCTRYDDKNDLYYVSLQAFKWFPKSDGILGN